MCICLQGKSGGGPSQPKFKKPPSSAQQQPNEQAQPAGETRHAPIAAVQNLVAERPTSVANGPGATQTHRQEEQACPLPASLEVRQPNDAIARENPVSVVHGEPFCAHLSDISFWLLLNSPG